MISVSFLCLPPHLGIYREGGHLAGSGIEEPTMMAQLAVTKKPRQHGQGARRESLIDEWFLSFERLDRRATR